MLNDKKIAFIICTDDERAFNEATYYLEKLSLPAGYEAEVVPVTDAVSMAAGYNRGMNSTDAKYKVYMHQDVYILNENFITDFLRVFEESDAGMIGMVGTPEMPPNAIQSKADRVGAVYSAGAYSIKREILDEHMEQGAWHQVEAIDGFCMITRVDIPWREDLFDGWDYYDASQSFEFRKAGYKVVVPHQDEPWCLHDCGYLNLRDYYRYRKVFVKEYADMLTEAPAFIPVEEQPLVSVVVACYNHKDFIADAINSVLSQTYSNIELIITDDGSTDGSKDIISDIIANHPEKNIHFLSPEKNTTFRIVEEGYWSGTGEYLIGMGGDDMMKPDRIMEQVDFLENHKGEYDLCSTWVDCVGNDEQKKAFFIDIFNRYSEGPGTRFKQLLLWRNHINAPSVMMRTSVYHIIGGYDFAFRQLQDYKLWAEMTVDHDLYIMPNQLTIYRVVAGSVSDSDQKGIGRDINEQYAFKYELLRNMTDEQFNRHFPDKNDQEYTPLDIMCRKVILMKDRAKSNFTFADIAARLWYLYTHEKGFEDLLESKYGVTRKDMYEFVGTQTIYSQLRFS